MHFDAAGVVVDAGDMSELAQVEIGIEFAIDAGEQVEIESGGHPQFVIVCPEQLGDWFFQIGAQKEGVTRAQSTPNLGQEFNAGMAIKIPNRASQKQHEEMLPALPASGHLQQAIQIFALKTYDTDGIDVAEFAHAGSKCRGEISTG